MLDLLTDPQAWASLATLTALEIVLGIDNIIFLSIVTGRLPEHQQPVARRIGIGLALLGRLVLLLSLTWLIGLTQPFIELGEFGLSWRDVVLIGGGAFLLVKGTVETHHMLEGEHGEGTAGTASFAAVLVQIIMLDLVFSLDSVITAVGMAEHIPIMVAAIVIAMIIMLVAAEPT
ncbi:MAG: TerC family protein, partial [Geminicoccaceae bacterium]